MVGELSLNEIHEHIKSGNLKPEDHYWAEGMASWEKIGQLLSSARKALYWRIAKITLATSLAILAMTYVIITYREGVKAELMQKAEKAQAEKIEKAKLISRLESELKGYEKTVEELLAATKNYSGTPYYQTQRMEGKHVPRLDLELYVDRYHGPTFIIHYASLKRIKKRFPFSGTGNTAEIKSEKGNLDLGDVWIREDEPVDFSGRNVYMGSIEIDNRHFKRMREILAENKGGSLRITLRTEFEGELSMKDLYYDSEWFPKLFEMADLVTKRILTSKRLDDLKK